MNNMAKRIYLKPELVIFELASSSMISASLGISDNTIDTYGRSRDYNDIFSNDMFLGVWDGEAK